MIIIIYWLSFSIFLYTTINKQLNKYRPITKGITSFCYVLIYLLFNHHFNIMMLMALIGCFLGDIFLAFKKINKIYFILGMLSFLLAHFFLLKVMIEYSPLNWLNFTMAIIALILLKIATLKLDIHFGFNRYIIWLYTFVIVLMGTKAINLAIFHSSLSTIILGIGGTIFIISDIILMLLYFKYKNNMKLQLANSYLYYFTLFLLAIAFHF